jgi:hypothetical protein
LKKKFDNAQEVRQRKRRGRRMLEPRFQRFKPHTDTDLVFLKDSPDYCDYDVKHGSLGTQGRECDPVSVPFKKKFNPHNNNNVFIVPRYKTKKPKAKSVLFTFLFCIVYL